MAEDNDFVSITDSLIKDKIVHVLTVYPGVSRSMLQVGIGPAISPKMWHPILDLLKNEGRVIETEEEVKGPTGRDQTHKHLTLVPADQAIPLKVRDILRV